MIQIRVDPEFESKIPPISKDEFEQLRENILEAGEVYEALVVWNGVLVDGHNRWKVIQENPNIKYKVREMHFSDKWAAFEWMYKNQLGRRNLTFEQRKYAIGKMYEARKKSKGNNAERGENGKYLIDQNDPTGNRPKSTAEAIAKEVGVAEPSVKRWERFAKGVDRIRDVNPEAADKILSGKARVTGKAVIELAKMERSEVEHAADDIINDQTIKRVSTKEDRERSAKAREIISSMKCNTEREYTLNMLLEDIQINSVAYFDALNAILDRHSELIDSASKSTICEAIQKYIIDVANDLRRKIR